MDDTPTIAWLGEAAGRQVRAAGLPGRSAEDLEPESLRDCRAVVLTPEHVATLRGWRASGLSAPAIVLTAMADVIEQRPALEPVVWSPPDADLRAALERLAGGSRARTLQLGPVSVDLERRVVEGARDERLTALEAGILAYLAARRGRVISKSELLQEVWGYRARSTNTVPVMVGRLRKKIEVDPSKPLWLLTARGGGYRLVHGPGAEPGTPLVHRSRRLAAVRSALGEGVARVSGLAGTGRSALVRRAVQDRTALWVALSGVRDEAALYEALSTVAGRRVVGPETMPGPSEVDVVVLEGVDGLESPVLERFLEGCAVPVVAIRQAPWADDIRVEPLTAEEATEQLVRLAAAQGTALQTPDAARLAARADGRLAVLDLLARWLESMSPDALLGLLDEGLRNESTVMDPIRARVATLSSAERELLQRLAGFEGAVPATQVVGLLGPPALSLSALQDQGLVEAGPLGWSTPSLVRLALCTPVLLARHDARLLVWVEARLSEVGTRSDRVAIQALASIHSSLRGAFERAIGTDDAAVVSFAEALLATSGLHGLPSSRLRIATRAVEACTHPVHRARAEVLLARVVPEPALQIEAIDRALPVLVDEADRAEARLHGAIARMRADDTAGAFAWLDALRNAPPVVALRASALRAWLEYRAGTRTEAEMIDRRLGTADRLLQLGAPGFAAQQVLLAVGKLRLTDAPRCVAPIERVTAALDEVADPAVHRRLRITEAELVAEVHGDVDRALSILETAIDQATRWEPDQVAVIEGVRGTVLWDAGRLDAARAALRRNLERERAVGVPLAELSVLLDLVGLELEAGDVTAAAAFIQAAEALGLDRYAGYVAFERGTVRMLGGLGGDASAAMRDFEEARSSELNATCAVSLGLRGVALSHRSSVPDTPWRAWLATQLDRAGGRVATDGRALLSAFDARKVRETPVRSGLNRVDRLALDLDRNQGQRPPDA